MEQHPDCYPAAAKHAGGQPYLIPPEKVANRAPPPSAQKETPKKTRQRERSPWQPRSLLIFGKSRSRLPEVW